MRLDNTRNPEIKIMKGDSGRIRGTLPHNPVFVEKVKIIKGRRWRSEDKYCLPAASLWQAGSFSSNKFIGKIKSPLDLIPKRSLNDEKN